MSTPTLAAALAAIKELADNTELRQFLIDPNQVDPEHMPDGHPWYTEPYYYIGEDHPSATVLPSEALLELLLRADDLLTDYLVHPEGHINESQRFDLVAAGYLLDIVVWQEEGNEKEDPQVISIAIPLPGGLYRCF